jgi:hypothetical protein
MSAYCLSCEETFNPPYQFIYCLINTDTNKKNYFYERPEFAFDYSYLKVELIRVDSDSDEYFVAVRNSQRIQNSYISIS